MNYLKQLETQLKAQNQRFTMTQKYLDKELVDTIRTNHINKCKPKTTRQKIDLPISG